MEKSSNSICFVCYRIFPDINFDNYSKYVYESGYNVSIVTYLKKNQKKFEILQGRKIYRIKIPKISSLRLKYLHFIINVARHLKKYKYDIIHIHHTCSYFLALKLLVPKKLKFIFHITSYPISDKNYKSIKQMILMFIQSLFMDKIIVQSEELKEKLIGIRKLKKAVIVPVGFNANYFYPITDQEKKSQRSKIGIGEKEILITYCGSVSKFRNLDNLIRSYKFVSRCIKDSRFMIIGDGDCLNDLKVIAKNNRIEKKIFFLGRIANNQIRKYIGMADIGISYVPINNNYNYNPPLKTFEYLALGLPIIATATVSNCRIIKNNFNGILVDDNPKSIADCIVKLIKNEKLRSKIIKNSIISSVNYNIRNITYLKLIPIYKSLIDKN